MKQTLEEQHDFLRLRALQSELFHSRVFLASPGRTLLRRGIAQGMWLNKRKIRGGVLVLMFSDVVVAALVPRVPGGAHQLVSACALHPSVTIERVNVHKFSITDRLLERSIEIELSQASTVGGWVEELKAAWRKRHEERMPVWDAEAWLTDRKRYVVFLSDKEMCVFQL